MKMHDLSREQTDITLDGPKIFKPSLQISAKQLPGLTALNIGDRVTIQIQCTVCDVVPPDAFDSRTSMIFDLVCERGSVISKQKTHPSTLPVQKIGGIPAVGMQSISPASGAFE
jgi:hypothetical protein